MQGSGRARVRSLRRELAVGPKVLKVLTTSTSSGPSVLTVVKFRAEHS